MSNFEVVLLEPAYEDLDDIIHYFYMHAEQHITLFLDEFERHKDHLTVSPYLFPKIHHVGFRRLYLSKYKYHIIFTIEEKNHRVVIHGIIHEKRHPRRWITKKS